MMEGRDNTPKTQRNEEIARRIQNGEEVAKIAVELGLSRQRIYQILRALLKKGIITEIPRKTSLASLVKETGFSYTTLVKKARILHHDQDRRKLSREQVESLKQILEKKCPFCEKPIRGCRKSCRESSPLYKKRLIEQRYKIEAIPENPKIDGVPDLVFTILEGVEPDSSRMLRFEQARRHTGLSRMQLIYLSRRGIIATRENLTRVWKGKPTREFYYNQCEVVRRGIQFYLRKTRCFPQEEQGRDGLSGLCG